MVKTFGKPSARSKLYASDLHCVIATPPFHNQIPLSGKFLLFNFPITSFELRFLFADPYTYFIIIATSTSLFFFDLVMAF